MMDWKDLRNIVGREAPLLGALIGGPAGGTIGAVVAAALGTASTPDAVSQALATNPDAAVKLRQIESDERVRLQGMVFAHADAELAAAAGVVQSVNSTMQAEAQSDHWPTYSWRPFCGFVFGVTFAGVYLVLPLAHVAVPVIPTEAWVAIGAVLGVASWFRGRMQADPRVPADARG